MHLGSALRFIVACSLLIAGPANAVKRLAVLVGANTGWSMDQPLRHADEDAQRLASTLRELGDFGPHDVVVLDDPSADALRKALDAAGAKLGSSEDALFVFYYSGHADERHLHLRGESPFSFEELYRRVRDLPGRVKIGILDACQSGSILAAKGGRPTQLFKVQVQDELAVRGTAFLTSSGADELSQEARALGGSVFSHHLISGLRGTADEDGDGRISLGEVYRYASGRTTLDTATSAGGAQRPGFRYELNGRGEVYLTRLQGPVGVLVFPPDGRRCYVTDLAERRLVAEVLGQRAQPALLAVPAGSYVLKCRGDDRYSVAPVTAPSGGRVEVASLAFRSMPLSDGVLKGPADGDGRSEGLSALKRRGFIELKEGRPEVALQTFDQVLGRDLRDQEAYRGKAQAYLALSRRAAEEGRTAEKEKYLAAAFRTDPRLEEDPELVRQKTAPPAAAPNVEEAQRLTELNLRRGHPRRYQRFGVGASLIDPHGVLAISLEAVVREKLQPAVHLTFLSPGMGASFRVVPRDGPWSPFFGAGGHLSLTALGVDRGNLDAEFKVNELTVARQSTFDRVLYLDAGFQGLAPQWQLDLGISLMYAHPLGQEPQLLAMPVLSLKYFFEPPGAHP